MEAVKQFPIPVVGAVGPGSQPEEADGVSLDVLPMPSAMSTYAMPILPEPEEIAELNEAKALLQSVIDALDRCRIRQTHESLDAGGLDAANLSLLDQTLGEGEVSIVMADRGIRIQESVLAGVWRVQQRNAEGEVSMDSIDVGPIPALVAETTFLHAAEQIVFDANALPDGLQNAPSLIAELNTAMAKPSRKDRPHVINLSLLPHTPEDLLWLAGLLGKGQVTILSRGYGNCRIVSTGTRNVWWVQYFNSQDMLILNTLEVTPVPEVACAAREDLEDSHERLTEILAVIS